MYGLKPVPFIKMDQIPGAKAPFLLRGVFRGLKAPAPSVRGG